MKEYGYHQISLILSTMKLHRIDFVYLVYGSLLYNNLGWHQVVGCEENCDVLSSEIIKCLSNCL